MNTIKTQFGDAASADFEEETWTFKMEKDFRVVSGKFAIVDKFVFNEMLIALKKMRKYFGEHDKTNEEHINYTVADNAIKLSDGDITNEIKR